MMFYVSMPFEKPVYDDIHYRNFAIKKKYKNEMLPMMNEILIDCM